MFCYWEPIPCTGFPPLSPAAAGHGYLTSSLRPVLHTHPHPENCHSDHHTRPSFSFFLQSRSCFQFDPSIIFVHWCHIYRGQEFCGEASRFLRDKYIFVVEARCGTSSIVNKRVRIRIYFFWVGIWWHLPLQTMLSIRLILCDNL